MSKQRRKYSSKTLLIALPVAILAAAELLIFLLISFGVIDLSVFTAILLVFVLSGITATAVYYMYNKMVNPLRVAKQALHNYVESQEIPSLPAQASDEAGLLLSNIHATITQLDALNVEKSDMIDLLSHDLRSPVGRIMNLSELIKYEDGADVNMYADYITNECRGLLRMLENILLMLREDNHVLGMASVSLEKILTETITFFDFSIADKKLNISVNIDRSIHIHVQPDLFIQAVRNILGNAIKFSPQGKTIYITGTQEMNKISLTIRDEGLGMKAEDITRIFDRFTKAGKKGTKGEASVGLGLYLSKKIIEKHEGELAATSEGVNKGAAFTITLHRLITKKPDKMLSKDLFVPSFLNNPTGKPLYNKPHFQ